MDYKAKKEERELSVVKHNEVVQKARYKLDLIQQKTILYLVSKIDSMKDDRFTDITVRLKDLCEIMGIEANGRSLNDIKEGLKKMADKSMWVELGDADNSITLMRWLAEVTINRGKSTVTVRFDDKMAPYLLKLENCFTRYKLINVLPMKSQYSLRMYELIMSHSGQGKWDVTLDDLKKLLYIDNLSTYSDYRDFKKRVLDPSLREICNFSDLSVAFSTKRIDRKIHSIVFEMCSIDEAHYSEGSRREINRDIVLENMPTEVVPPKKMPTIKDVRLLRLKQYQTKEREKLEKKYRAAKTAGEKKEDLFMPGQLSFQEISM